MDKINFLVLWVGTTCTLKCENCCNLIPYGKNVLYDTDTIVENLSYMTKTVGIDRLQIQGGEPLTCSNLHKVVKATLEMPIKHIDIASNGTIIPDDLFLSTIKMLGDRGSFHISNYDCVDESRKSAVEKRLRNTE